MSMKIYLRKLDIEEEEVDRRFEKRIFQRTEIKNSLGFSKSNRIGQNLLSI